MVRSQNASSRRTFLRTAAVVTATLPPGFGKPRSMSLKIGLQLYTVGKEMDADPFGTLKRIAAVGYRVVEASPLAKLTSADLKRGLDDAGLTSPSGHHLLQDLLVSLPQKIEAAKQLGQEYMIVTVPWVADPSRLQNGPSDPMQAFVSVLNSLTLDDWKWNAEQFNRVGEQVKKAGLTLGYHNHNFEFKSYGATTGYDEFLRLTDPALVKFELDCGWAIVAGRDPVEYLKKFPERYRLLHIKDFHKGFSPTTTLLSQGPTAPVPTELGRGSIDYQPILSEAAKANIRTVFVEQEPPFTEMPALEAIEVDYKYINAVHV